MNMFKKCDTGWTLGMGVIGWTKGKWDDGWTHVNWMTNEPMGSWSMDEHGKCVSYPFLWVFTTIFVTLLHSWPFHQSQVTCVKITKAMVNFAIDHLNLFN
jgi:hypothetical protein